MAVAVKEKIRGEKLRYDFGTVMCVVMTTASALVEAIVNKFSEAVGEVSKRRSIVQQCCLFRLAVDRVLFALRAPVCFLISGSASGFQFTWLCCAGAISRVTEYVYPFKLPYLTAVCHSVRPYIC